METAHTNLKNSILSIFKLINFKLNLIIPSDEMKLLGIFKDSSFVNPFRMDRVGSVSFLWFTDFRSLWASARSTGLVSRSSFPSKRAMTLFI